MARIAALLLGLLGSPYEHDVQWSAPPECPDRGAVVRGIEHWLARASVETSGVSARGIVHAHASGYRVTLSVTTPEGTSERVLEATSCVELSSTAALIIAMAIDARGLATEEPRVEDPAGLEAPEAGEGTPISDGSSPGAFVRDPTNRGSGEPTTNEPSSAEPASARDAPEDTRAPAPAATPTPRDAGAAALEGVNGSNSVREPASRPMRGYGRVQVGLSLGPLPEPAAALVFGVAVGGPWFRVELTGGGSPPVEAPVRGGPGRVRAQLWAAGVRACGVPHRRRIEVPLCLGTDLGAMLAEGRALARSDRARASWTAVVASVGIVWWPLRRFGVDARVEGLVVPRRPVFTIDPGRLAHQAGLFGFTVLVGPVVRLP